MNIDCFQIHPVGYIKKHDNDQSVSIEILEKYKPGLLGLNTFSHIVVCYWFHKNDIPEQRNILQVYPRKNKSNPLSGVFATHSNVRPNLTAISICKLHSINDNIMYIDKIDAFDKTPVIDIKPYIPGAKKISDLKLPEWV